MSDEHRPECPTLCHSPQEQCQEWPWELQSLAPILQSPPSPQFLCLGLVTALPFLLLLLALAEDVKLWVRLKHSHTSSHK